MGGVASHGLSFESKDGIFNLALDKPFVALAYGLYHCQSRSGVQVEVGKTMADTIGFAIEDNFFAMGGQLRSIPRQYDS